MIEKKRLNDIFTDWKLGKGIFYYLNQLDIPWKTTVPSSALDFEYHGNYSGKKLPSPALTSLVETTVTDTDGQMLASTLFAICGENWSRMWEALQDVYEPIENYAMKEVMSDNETSTVYGKTNTRTPNLNEDVTNKVYGFNDITSANTANKTESVSSGTETYADSGTDTVKNSYTLTRTGNIGVTTSQQMLQSEYELRKRNYFRDIVYPDVDKLLTIPYY